MTYEAIVDGRMSGYVAGETEEAAMTEAKRLWPSHKIVLKKQSDKAKGLEDLLAEVQADAIAIEDNLSGADEVVLWWEDDSTVNHFNWDSESGEWKRGAVYTMEDFDHWNDVLNEDEAIEMVKGE